MDNKQIIQALLNWEYLPKKELPQAKRIVNMLAVELNQRLKLNKIEPLKITSK